MPCSNTGNLTKTLVSLARKLLGAPTVSDTLETVTLGDGNDIDHLILLQNRADIHSLFKMIIGKFDLVCDRSTVQLNFHDMSLLLTNLDLADLGMNNDANNRAVLLDTLKLAENGLGAIGVL